MKAKKPDSLAKHKIIHQQAMAWGDMDAMQHLNNTKYFYYCETARIEFIRKLFPNFGSDSLSAMKTGLALAETGCRFKVSLRYPDTVLIGTAVSEIRDTQFSLKHSMFSEKMGLIAAEAHATMVHYDFERNQRLTFDDELMSILTRYRFSQD